tara:strand:+ start:563 stop:721 length:159 start_codon:yes stop_codon:yes gene_type:complete
MNDLNEDKQKAEEIMNEIRSNYSRAKGVSRKFWELFAANAAQALEIAKLKFK